MKDGNCPKCQSEDIIGDLVVPDHVDYGVHASSMLKVERTPQNIIFKGVESFEIRAWVCGNCGSLNTM